MFQLGGLHPDRSELEEVRGHAPAPMRSKNLQIALNRTTAGVALVSALALGSGAGLLLLPQAAQAAQAKPTAKWKIGDCFFFADRWWCP
jgi:hypothetical protein